ncbi:hypothetical protein BC829DRAFT_494043 [Chytridium lagenaria]|nr:hypothetical protein BC829DRAFT_494043 [Chytridium lagenaria]
MPTTTTFHPALFSIIANIPTLRQRYHNDALERLWTTTDAILESTVHSNTSMDIDHIDTDAMSTDKGTFFQGVTMPLEVSRTMLDETFGEDDPLLRLTSEAGNMGALVMLALDRMARRCGGMTESRMVEGVWEVKGKMRRFEGLVVEVDGGGVVRDVYDGLEDYVDGFGGDDAGLSLVPGLLVVGLRRRKEVGVEMRKRGREARRDRDEGLKGLAPLVKRNLEGLTAEEVFRKAAEEVRKDAAGKDEEGRERGERVADYLLERAGRVAKEVDAFKTKIMNAESRCDARAVEALSLGTSPEHPTPSSRTAL